MDTFLGHFWDASDILWDQKYGQEWLLSTPAIMAELERHDEADMSCGIKPLVALLYIVLMPPSKMSMYINIIAEIIK